MPKVIIQNVVVHASVRKFEWLMAGVMIHLGIGLHGETEIFASSKSYDEIARMFSEETWAFIFFLFGVCRLIVLFLNGTHIKPSAEIRAIMSGGAFFIFAALAMGIDAANPATIGGITYKWLALGELANVWQAVSDARNRSKKNGGYL